MSEKQVKKTHIRWLSIVCILILVPCTLLLSWKFGNRKYYLSSLILIIIAMLPFFLSFEKRKPQARELVSLAVMIAIAVVSRAIFIMLPNFKPMVGIIMITGMAFGAEAGFLTGAMSAFVSNFIFGQGPWTPWQMFAYGIAGFIAGILASRGILKGDKPVRAAVIGGICVMVIVGPLLDTSTFFMLSSGMNTESAAAVYLAGLPVNAVHATATVLTLLLFTRPLMEKLDRIKLKYGMMGGGEHAI